MPRTTLTALFVAALTAVLATGCSAPVPGNAAPEPAVEGVAPPQEPADAPPTDGPVASVEAVRWVDGLCVALAPFAEAVTTQPQIDPGNIDTAVAQLSDHLGESVSSLDGALSTLDGVGPSPVEGGDELVDRLRDTFSDYRATFATAQADVDAVDPADPADLLEALPAAVAPIQELGELPDPTADLRDNPELDAAARQASNCAVLLTG